MYRNLEIALTHKIIARRTMCLIKRLQNLTKKKDIVVRLVYRNDQKI